MAVLLLLPVVRQDGVEVHAAAEVHRQGVVDLNVDKIIQLRLELRAWAFLKHLFINLRPCKANDN